MSDSNDTSNDTITPDDIDSSPSELPSKLGDTVKSDSDYKSKFLEVSEDNVYLKEQHTKLRARVRELESTAHTNEILDSLIVPMSEKIFKFMCVYCASVGFIVLCSSFSQNFPESVLKVLVGSTAVTVIGLVGTIVAGIFAGARRHHN